MEFLYSIVGLTIRKDTRRDVSIGVTFKNYFHNKDQIQDYQGGFHNPRQHYHKNRHLDPRNVS